MRDKRRVKGNLMKPPRVTGRVSRPLMGKTTVLDEGADENAQRGNEHPRIALEHFNNSHTNEQGEQRKNQNGRGKFHWLGF